MTETVTLGKSLAERGEIAGGATVSPAPPRKIRTFGATRRAGFTLVEMLLVIAIIAILAGLVLAAASKARLRARINKSKLEVRELVRAWGAYWDTYGKWPRDFDEDEEMTADAMQSLLGQNDQRIVFLDVKPDVWKEGFRDPWGKMYKVNFSVKQTAEPEEAYQTRVQFMNRNRYRYD